MPFADWDASVVNPIFYGLAVLSSLLIIYIAISRRSLDSKHLVAEPIFGEWKPVHFQFPKISPCPVKVEDLDPISYRPFKSQYHVTMGIRPMGWDEWVEIDNTFPKYHAIREHRRKTKGEDVITLLPNARSAYQSAVELVHELAEFLHQRHPSAYRVTRDDSVGFIKTIEIPVKGAARYELPIPLIEDKCSLELRAVTIEEALHAMEVISSIAVDDWALMVEGSDGRYYVQGGAICMAGSWRLQDKIGMPLDEVHVHGGVPQYKEKLHVGMSRFFRRLPVDKPVIRNNYSIQVVPAARPSDLDVVDPEELAWSTSLHGPESDFDDNVRARPPVQPTVTVETLRLRSERQTLRRLPLTGVVVFGIRTYTYRVQDLVNERGVPRRLASAVRSWGEDVSEYKGRKLYEDVLLPYLDSKAEEQGDEETAPI